MLGPRNGAKFWDWRKAMTVIPVFEVPWERSGIIQPGLPILPHGVQRHPVPGGGSRAVPVFKGDDIIVQDREGLQPGELVFFAPDKTSDAAMLGAKGQGRPTATLETLAKQDTFKLLLHDEDIYAKPLPMSELEIKTFYEKKHLAIGKKIKYVRFQLSKNDE